MAKVVVEIASDGKYCDACHHRYSDMETFSGPSYCTLFDVDLVDEIKSGRTLRHKTCRNAETQE